MSNLDRVYIVTSGEYSDYGISSVWTTREAAERNAAGWGEVEEWLLNTTTEREIVEWHAWINQRSGDIEVADRASTTPSPGRTHVIKNRLGTYGIRVEGHVAEWYGHGYGPTPEHARKSLSDALARAKAEEMDAAE